MITEKIIEKKELIATIELSNTVRFVKVTKGLTKIINDLLTIKYDALEFNSHRMGIYLNDKRQITYFGFGCQQVPANMLKRELELYLKGPETKNIKNIRKKGSKVKTKVEYKEESSSYYISSTGKSFPKKEYEVVDSTITKSSVFTKNKSVNRIMYNGYHILPIDEEKDFIKIINYMIEIDEAVKKAIKEQK